MSNSSSISSLSIANQVIFRESANQSFLGKWKSLFPGLGFAAGYKITQRVYKFGGQPMVKDYLRTNHSAVFTRTFGEKNGVSLMSATAGSLIGIGEVALVSHRMLAFA